MDMTHDDVSTVDVPDAVATRPERSARSGRGPIIVAQTGVIILALLVWWCASAMLPAGIVPGPLDTFGTLVALTTTVPFWGAVAETVWSFGVSLVLCIVIGVPLGLAIGSSRIATQSTRLVFDFLRTIPPIAILPLVLLVFGPTFEMVVVVVALGAIWPILIQAVYAAGQGEALLKDMAASFRIPRAWYVTRIFLPGALPFVMTGVRVGTTVCLLLTITAELLGGAPGVGAEIAEAQVALDNPQMYAYVMVAAILGLLVNLGFWAVQRRLLHWHASNRTGTAS